MKHIGELVEGAQNVLQQLWEKNQHVQQVNQTLPNILPKPLAVHCRVVNVREQTAVIYTDSAAWATRLRYLVPQILQVWQQQAFTIQKIEIKVQLETSVATEPTLHTTLAPETTISKTRGPYPLTQNAANYLRHTAETTEHPRLKAVLLRLASRSQTGKGCK
jgi:hypothetical protein